MSDTVDVLVTSITDGVVASVAAWGKQSLGDEVKLCIRNSWNKGVLGVVTMLHAHMARNAEIVVITGGASYEVLFCEICNRCQQILKSFKRVLKPTFNTRIASAGRCSSLRLLRLHKSSLGCRESGLGRNSLSGAVDDLPILHETLYHPVSIATAEDTIINTILAEIKVTVIASAAVIVLIWNGFGAVITINREDADGGRSCHAILHPKSILTLLGHTSKLRKPFIAGSRTTADRNI